MRANVAPAKLTLSRGVALIAGLLLLSSMMVLALAVGTGMLLERRMAANAHDSQLALQRALIAERWAGSWLESMQENPLDPMCTDNCGSVPPFFESGQVPASPEHRDLSWWQLNAGAAGIEPISGQVHMNYSLAAAEDPLWLIEELHTLAIEGAVADPGEPEPLLGFYRILGRGTGRHPGSVAVTESIIARPWFNGYTPSAFPPGADASWPCEAVSADIPCGKLSWRRLR